MDQCNSCSQKRIGKYCDKLPTSQSPANICYNIWKIIMTFFIIIIMMTFCLLSISQVSYLVIHVYHVCPSLYMKFWLIFWLIGAGFLDISKAFDKVWHLRLLFKLRRDGFEYNLNKLLESYLHNWKQRVLPDDQCRPWKIVLSSVPKVSMLGHLLFLIYINYLPGGIISFCKIF